MQLSGLTVGCTEEMTGKGRRLIISDAMTESGLLEGLCGCLKLTVKEKKEKLNENQKNFQERRNVRSWILKAPKRRKIQQTGVKMTQIAEGIPFEEDYHDSMDGESYKCYFEKSGCQNTPLF